MPRPARFVSLDRLWLLLVGGGALLAVVAPAGLSGGSTQADALRAGAALKEPATIRYARDIRPILSDRCFQCHGPDAANRAGKFRLDQREFAVGPRDGGPAIVPGSLKDSVLWHKITAADPADRMPPPASTKPPLSAEQKELIGRWIEGGAEYEPHWAFVAPTRPEVPAPRDSAWPRNEIDRFVLDRLEAAGVNPSPTAAPETLLRRLFLDLTGLPPTPEELDAFLADPSPQAYDRWVDRLLSKEPYRTRTAERLAVPWLDAARYADTAGIHMDAGRQMWLWRDWVINAYRDNMPFDRFLTEQLAGDLIPDATVQQRIASGFNRNHTTTDEGGAIAEEYLVEYAVDRAATVGSVFLGLTVGCARCHDHKFDPITNEDFYSFYAFFNSIEEPGLYSQTQDPSRAHEPFITVPIPEQQARLDALAQSLASLQEQQQNIPEEDLRRRDEFFAQLPGKLGVKWASTQTVDARSSGGATLEVRADGTVLASGKNPAQDAHEFTLRGEVDGSNRTLLLVEALADPSLAGRVGRAGNGNAVLTGVEIETAGAGDEPAQPVGISWVWSNMAQADGNYDATGALLGGVLNDRGWAVGGHQGEKGARTLLVLTDKPLPTGADVRVRLRYQSLHGQHVLGCVRLTLGSVADPSKLPLSAGHWHATGPFDADNRDTVYDQAFGPESEATLDLSREFGTAKRKWRFEGRLKDNVIVNLDDGTNSTYLGRMVYAPTARTLDVLVGSDDGFRIFVNGKEAAGKKIERGIIIDSDRASLPLQEGANFVVFKVVNTGGAAAYSFRPLRDESVLPLEVTQAILPESARAGLSVERLHTAWREAFSPAFAARQVEITTLTKERDQLNAMVPRTMVMKETAKPRETFVLTRGQYDHPDKARPITRGIPPALGSLPAEAPANRLGLAQWLMSADNPLVARVAVNRMWEMLFGTGIVPTSEDFGQQGEWPSHPELLDWLAVEFRESGWDVRHMLRLIVTSQTYRQGSAIRLEVRERDPDNRLLASYPRRRLPAEHIRDLALSVSGLLVEETGGASVKPYQPEGLWQEVAMPQSNTRVFARGKGSEVWRRSLYTYWKRAAPPPSLLTFDAPTREVCVIRRASTSTPLQALVLWNDPQYVEASRVLAQRTLERAGDDESRITELYRRCTGHTPGSDDLEILHKALGDFRTRFQAAPEDAAKLTSIGEAPVPEAFPSDKRGELAAWTMLANSVLNLYRTTTQE